MESVVVRAKLVIYALPLLADTPYLFVANFEHLATTLK
jgi:hypothetical protein